MAAFQSPDEVYVQFGRSAIFEHSDHNGRGSAQVLGTAFLLLPCAYDEMHLSSSSYTDGCVDSRRHKTKSSDRRASHMQDSTASVQVDRIGMDNMNGIDVCS